MDNMEEKLGTILNNPQLMQQIMSMAQSLGNTQANTDAKRPNAKDAELPPLDLSIIQNLNGFLQQTGMDENQQALLNALSPYLSQDRVSRLERAMRAAKIARIASGFLEKRQQLPLGR